MKVDTDSCSLIFTEEFACPYFGDGRRASVEYRLPDEDEAEHYHEYLAAGYRRLGSLFYRNVCTRCAACVPLRIAVPQFQISRSQKRTLRKNPDLRVECRSPGSLSLEKFILYEQYLRTKHGGSAERSYAEYEAHLTSIHYGYAGIIEMCYYDGDKLVGVGIVDEAADALSSNYFYYDTEHSGRRLGVFSILQEIELAHTMGKPYHYLGFSIEHNPKMAYKRSFRPNEVLTGDGWRRSLA